MTKVILARREFLVSLLLTPAIVRDSSLMRLARPRYFGLPVFFDTVGFVFRRVAEAEADAWYDAHARFANNVPRLPVWHEDMRGPLTAAVVKRQMILSTPQG